MKNSVLLSIICPAYNAEKTIGKLIESIVSQKYKNYEFIILNDGSKDKTFEVIEGYAKKYKNIVAIDKPNTGVGDTRNEGLKIAKGKYITFADADDWYSDDFFEKIIPEIKKEDFDLLVFNAKVMNFDEYMYDLIPKKYKEGSFVTCDGVKKYLQGEFCHKIVNVPWNKIYLKDVITKNNLKYDEDKKSGEDLIFNVSYVAKIKKYKYIDEKLYYYVAKFNNDGQLNYDYKLNSEVFKYYDLLENECIKNKINDYPKFLGLFFLRKFWGIIINEINCDNVKKGLENINNYLEQPEIKKVLREVEFKNFDIKLFFSFVLYKFKLYKINYYFLWFHKHK